MNTFLRKAAIILFVLGVMATEFSNALPVDSPPSDPNMFKDLPTLDSITEVHSGAIAQHIPAANLTAFGVDNHHLSDALMNNIPDSVPHHIERRDVTPSYDVNDVSKGVIGLLLGEMPEVGGIVSGLVGIFWPDSSNNVWDEIKAQVEALVNQKISADVYERVSNRLVGLRNVLNYYLQAIKDSSEQPQVVEDYYISASDLFVEALPDFQSPSYQFLLLPLFAQFANMHLALLRDGAIFGGPSWGWTQAATNTARKRLSDSINAYFDYTAQVYNAKLATIKPALNKKYCEPFKTTNIFVRNMTLSVLDHANTWSYFNNTDQPVDVVLTREVYSDPVGRCDDTGLTMPSSPAHKPPTSLTVWGWDRIDAIQLGYDAGMGPNNATVTPRMGDSNGGANYYPHGGSFSIGENHGYGYITHVGGNAGDIVNSMYINAQKGSSWVLGGNYPGGSPYSLSIDGHVVSSMYVPGISNYYKSANALVVGWMMTPKPPQATSVQAVQAVYVSAPQELDVPTLLAAADVTDPAQVSTVMEQVPEWDAQRQQVQDQRAADTQAYMDNSTSPDSTNITTQTVALPTSTESAPVNTEVPPPSTAGISTSDAPINTEVPPPVLPTGVPVNTELVPPPLLPTDVVNNIEVPPSAISIDALVNTDVPPPLIPIDVPANTDQASPSTSSSTDAAVSTDLPPISQPFVPPASMNSAVAKGLPAFVPSVASSNSNVHAATAANNNNDSNNNLPSNAALPSAPQLA